MNDTLAEKNAARVKILPLRETIFQEARIVRLGPPPDNAGILIRGGMAWVLGILTKPLPTDPRIVRLQEPETMDQVMVAMWRELAYQWVQRRGTFAESNGKAKNSKEPDGGDLLLNYAQIEQRFVTNAGAMWSGGQEIPEAASAMSVKPTLRNQDVTIKADHGGLCSCSTEMKCCSTSCSMCGARSDPVSFGLGMFQQSDPYITNFLTNA